MRTRERPSPTITGVTVSKSKPFNQAWTPLATSPGYVISSGAERIVDVSTPNAKKLMAKGVIINNPLTYTKSAFVASETETAYAWTYDKGKLSGEYFREGACTVYYIHASQPIFTHDASYNLASMLQSVKLRALAKIDSTDFAFGEDALELRETTKTIRTILKLIKNPLVEIRAISKKIQKASRKNERVLNMNQYDALNSAYLQYRFAITPLVRSTTDAISAMSKELKTFKQRYSSREREKETLKSVSTFDAGYADFTQTVEISVEASANILYELAKYLEVFGYEAGWQDKLGFRGKDIAPTLWAVSRLSFMVDRVFDITSMLKGLANLSDSRVNILAASYSTKIVTTTITTCLHKNSYGSDGSVTARREFHGTPTTSVTVNKSRSPWKPNPFDLVPPLRGMGLFKDIMGVADLAAISYSILSGRSR